MPLTFPAHQAAVLPLKLWKPQSFDGTALVVAAAAPDLAYPLGSWLGRQSHTAIGLLVWAVPVTLVICRLLRWRVASGLFAQLPDGGPLRLRSYRSLTRRRPSLARTAVSALIGAASHVVIDGFTHGNRWGAQFFGWDAVIGELPARGQFTVARLLQYAGHTAGSALGLGMLVWIGRQRLMERWYGESVVEEDRRASVSPRQRMLFWLAVLGISAIAFLVGDRGSPFALIAGGTLGLLVGGLMPVGSVPPGPSRCGRHR
jgi:hypothetical protein